MLASDCHGYFTSAIARKVGVRSCELDRWMKIGRLEKHARGVYRIANYPPSAIEPYVRAVLASGTGAVLYGESVLGMLNLIPTNPTWIYVATPVRARRNVGQGIRIVKTQVNSIDNYDGVPMQGVADAICEAEVRSNCGMVVRPRDIPWILTRRETWRKPNSSHVSTAVWRVGGMAFLDAL